MRNTWNIGQKRRLYRLALSVIWAIWMLGLAGCMEKDSPPSEGTYSVYYKNISHTGINYYSYEANGNTREELVQELWKQLCWKPEEADRESVVPADVMLLTFSLDSNNISMYFNSALSEMDTAAQLLFRAAVVKTFTGIEGIETVTFFADEKPLTDQSYTPLGAQSSSDYVDIISNGLSSTRKTTLVLYYTDETGETLVRHTKDIVYESSYSLERDVINRLIQGPDEEGYYATLPSSLKLISINVKDGTCYVNFDSAFLTDSLPISGYTIVYSIVNSLSELAEVKRVQIMINGDSNVTFKENISLASPLERNLNLVE